MSTLHDLRSTLERHADAVEDTERYLRPVAVRARIGAVRRRRTALAASAAVLVLVVGLAAAGVLRGGATDIQPVDRVVAGVDVPVSIEVLGFPYEVTSVTDLTDDRTRVDPAARAQAVVLAASGLGAGSATLYSQGEPVARVRGDQQVSAPVDLGEAGTDLEVRFDGTAAGARAGAAVYEATGGLAVGVGADNGATVFREEMADAPLVSGAFLVPGERTFDLVVPSTGEPLRFVFYCTAPEDLWVQVSIDGEDEALGSSCGDTAALDAGAGTSSTVRLPSGDHDVRFYLTDGPDGDEIAPPDGAVLGMGVYALPPDGPRVEGTRVDTHLEYGGRTWVLDGVRGDAASIDTSDGDVLLGVVGRGDGIHAVWSGRLTSGETPRVETRDDAILAYGSVLLAGDRYSVGIGRGLGRLLVYRPE